MENLEELYSKLKSTDKNKIDNIIYKNSILLNISNSLDDISQTKLNPTQLKSITNELYTIFTSTGYSYEKILNILNNKRKKFTDNSKLENALGPDTLKLTKLLLNYKPKLHNNPLGAGEFLIAYSYSNVKKLPKGDLSIDGKPFELKASIDSKSGGGKLNNINSKNYASTQFVFNRLIDQLNKQGLDTDDPNKYNFNDKGIKNLNKMFNKHDKEIFIRTAIRRLYPKLGEISKLLDGINFDNLSNFIDVFGDIQIKYYMKTEKTNLMFINVNNMSYKKILTDSNINTKGLIIKNSFSWKQSNNNVFQYSI